MCNVQKLHTGLRFVYFISVLLLHLNYTYLLVHNDICVYEMYSHVTAINY